MEALEFGKLVRCRALGQTQGWGEYAYKTNINPMDNGFVGLVTACRGKSGTWEKFKTYGLAPDGHAKISYAVVDAPSSVAEDIITQEHEAASRKAYGFWKNSSLSGLSCYLTRKSVGAYGIRFRSSAEYGNVAVVPMFDEQGRLWNYQILNPDGTKRMAKNGRTVGLFHILNPLVNGSPIGIAESYATAATCFALSGAPTVCAFSSENLVAVAKSIRKLYSECRIILFADNDRHLEIEGMPNKGICKAQEAIDCVEGCVDMVAPDFGDLKPSRDASDWNDLVRLNGVEFAKVQILKFIRR